MQQPENNLILEKLKQITENSWMSNNSCDEVYKNLILGDGSAATDIKTLERLSVTHILNASQGDDEDCFVNTNEEFYKNLNYPCKFMGIPAMDVTACQLHPYFNAAAEFIDDGLKNSTNDGKVLVHCLQGMSRSATLVIAYLMICKEMHVVQAAQVVKSRRDICPNEGFLQQLCDLQIKLEGKKH